MSGSVLSRASSPHENLAPAGAMPAPAATLVIFGAHGDLTKRLLMPALYDLTTSGLLDDQFKIIGVDLAEGDTKAWAGELTATMQSFTKDPNAEFYVEKLDDVAWGWVQQRLTYLRADFTKPEDMAKVKAAVQGNVIFYFAVAARFFGPLVDQLGQAGLLQEDESAFRRVVIEKPFGEDLASATALNARVLSHASEKQVFRIDHFLGKETVQNIMVLRFANGIFEPLWRRDHIDFIEITAAETIGVEGRGKFYEPTGALRDMVPNHLFQLLSMVAMEAPYSFDAEAVRDEKAKLLKAIHPITAHHVVRGQYEAGEVGGKQVPGYRDEPNVAADSKTETYVAMQLNIDNWRWAGVPFYLRTGKHLAARQTEVVIHFRRPPFMLFRDTEVEALTANTLTITVQPHEGMRLAMSAKYPGPKMVLSPIDLKFDYEDAFARRPNVGYESLIYDCLIGDPTLFQRADMIEASWAVVDNVLHTDAAPEPYKAGSQGPECADTLLGRMHHAWHELKAKK